MLTQNGLGQSINQPGQVGSGQVRPGRKIQTHEDDNTDPQKILTVLPLEDCKRPPGRPRITRLKTVQNDLESHNLTLTEALDTAQNCPIWQRSALHTPAVEANNDDVKSSNTDVTHIPPCAYVL